nr:MAG TPA: hypothetical protein [Caudoviricetes sp.]
MKRGENIPDTERLREGKDPVDSCIIGYRGGLSRENFLKNLV